MKYQLAQEQLQKALTNTYFANLRFLEICDKNLFKRIENLSYAIDNNLYTQRYELDFLENKGEFDIFDIKENIYLYKKDPKNFNSKLIKTANLKREGYFSLLENSVYSDERDFLYFNKEELQESEDGNILLFNDLSKYIHLLKQKNKNNHTLKSVDKFIFIGTLLGRHFNQIINKIQAKTYFVCEQNLEIFRLSLFVFDYTIFLSNDANIIFSIMEENKIIETKFYNFLQHDSWGNHTIKYCTTDYNIVDLFDNLMNACISFKPTTFNYHMILHNVLRNATERIDKYPIMSTPIEYFSDEIINKPLLLIGAGPSFSDNIDWINKNKDNFIIASLGASYKKLLDNDINSDIIITLDSSYLVLDKLQFDKEYTKKIQNSIVLASTNTAKQLLDRFNQNSLYLFEVMLSLKENKILPDGYSVGEISYAYLLSLGFKNIYLLGLDFAINQTSGSSHGDENYSVTSKYDLSKDNEVFKTGIFDLREDLIKVEGNFHKKVFTNRIFNSSINCFNKITLKRKTEHQSIFNLSTHGAKLENTITQQINLLKDFQKLNKEEVSTSLNKYLKDLTKQKALNSKDRLKFKEQLVKLTIINSELETIKNKTYTDYFILKEDISNFLNNIYRNKLFFNSYISHILEKFTSTISIYIDYSFNNNKISNEKYKLNTVKDFLIEDLQIIIDDYKKYINNINLGND